MNCMKCGREIRDDMAFCPKCLERMDKNPVKPNVVVQLPLRRETPVKKAPPRKKVLSPEDQIQRLKKKNRWLTALLCFFLVCTLLLFSLTIGFFRQLDVQKMLGQNYTTAETAN